MKSLLLLLSLFLLCGCEDSFPPAGDPDAQALGVNTRIIYSQYLGVDSIGIFSILPDGTDRRFVAFGTATSSPNHGRIAFVRNTGGTTAVMIARLDGSDTLTLASVPDTTGRLLRFATLSPRGDRVAYVLHQEMQDSGDASIFIVDAGGGSSRMLTSDIVRGGVPYFSPDGSRIAWHTFDGKIRSIMVDGTGLVTVADGALVTSELRPTLSWSPSSDRIAYVREIDRVIGELEVVNIDGTGRRSLTLGLGQYIAYPSWSPDGRRIAFIATQTPSGRDFARVDIWAINVDGTERERIVEADTAAPRRERVIAPEWAPDGTSILYTRHMVGTAYPARGFNRGIGTIEVIALSGRVMSIELAPNPSFDGFWVR